MAEAVSKNPYGGWKIFLVGILFLTIGIYLWLKLRWTMSKSVPPSRQKEIVEKAKEFIDKHYKDFNINHGKGAKALQISDGYLSHLFKKELGQNFNFYLPKIRVLNSKALLNKSAMKVTDIALEVGFKSLDTYLVVFRKLEKKTPTEFRKKN